NYIDNGGKVQVSIDKSGGYYYMDPQEMYKPGTAKFKIYDRGSQYFMSWEAIPQFVCSKNPDLWFNIRFPPLAKYGFVPVPDQTYGRNIYSMFTKRNPIHVGEAYSTYSNPTEAYKLDYSMILDEKGTIEKGKQLKISIGNNVTKTIGSQDLKIGDGTFQNVGAIGVVFYYPIKVTYWKVTDETIDESVTINNPVPPGNETNNTSAKATGIIKADNRGKEKFNVLKGIPSSENLYTNVFAKNLLENYKFTKKTATAQYQYIVDITFHLSWTDWVPDYATIYDGPPDDYCQDTDGDGVNDSCPGHTVPNGGHHEKHESNETGTLTYNINQGYSYWVIDKLDIYKIEKAVVRNSAIKGGSIELTPKGYSAPTISVDHSDSANDHVTMPTTFTYDKNSGKYVKRVHRDVYLTDYKSVPDWAVPDYQPEANLEVANDPVKVKNDKLVIYGTPIMDQTSCAFTTSDPSTMPNPSNTGKDVLYANGLEIDDTEANGVKTSSGTIYYKRVPTSDLTAGPEEITAPIENINSVTVHTPVVCNGAALSDVTYNQMVKPDSKRASMVLGTASQVKITSEGQHLNILGYGDRDYAHYVKAKYVSWPFDVYIGTDEKGKFIKKESWYKVPDEKDIVDFYIPIWVKEDNYVIKYKTVAINAPNANDHTQTNANLNISNYIATDTCNVQVSGRLYGFRISDISDYPLWEKVFREKSNSTSHTNNYYRVGSKDLNGDPLSINPLFTLPIMNGSNELYKNKGALKTGTSFKFELYSIGNYYGDKDYIQLDPTFWFVKKDGTGRQRVDLYYNEKFNGKEHYFVKVGSEQDHQNMHYTKLTDRYRNVPDSEITNTCNALGIDKKTFTKQNAKLGWYDSIILTKPLRTVAGATDKLPPGVAWKDAVTARQHWYGQYTLPDKCYAVPYGYNVMGYSKVHKGLDGKEPIWLKNGYIIVNFNISAFKNGELEHPYLSYYKAPYCNMWETEGFDYSKKDYSGANFTLSDGDTVFYYADKRLSDDYTSGVTH
ncbi:MAG TPA: DUF5704 domain-containing protein, partial [Clostridia bacterium]|nr:DUF5704 domain-containing protein [Clostridia bacterium]